MTLLARIVFSGTLALCSSLVLLAQHGAGGHGVSGAGGRAAAASGYGGQAFAAPPIGTINSVPPGSSRLFSAPSIGTRNAVPPGRARLGYGYGYRYNNGYARGYNRYRTYPFAYWLTPYYYPGLFYDTGPFYDSSYGSYPYDAGPNSYMDEQGLAENVPPPYYYPPQGPYAPPPPNYYSNPPSGSSAPGAQSSQTPLAPPVTLVLRNGEKFQVQNYAVMGQTFWDFSKQPVRKIPIGSIDLPASAKATEASGAEFPPIS